MENVPSLEKMSDEELMSLRFCDLNLKIEGTPLEDQVSRLYKELDGAGIQLRPECYLADEWLAPDDEPVIGVAFYLAHSRLAKLEQTMMLDVEGGTPKTCMMLLRHEAGHAVNSAYRLQRRKKWKELFGSSKAHYPDHPDEYTYKPFSKRFVQHLEDWYTEIDVIAALKQLGHSVRILGVYDDITLIVDEIKKKRPDVVFNLTEVFLGKAHFDKNVVALLEMMEIPHTGCGPEGLTVSGDKALSKTVLTYHRIKVPRFHVFRKGKRIWHPKRLRLPAIIKPLREHASTGIAQASYVENEGDFCGRIKFIHESMNMDAIAEEYIDGRELYASVLGNNRLKTFPLREVKFTEVPDDEPKIATYKAKWDEKYRERWGIKNVLADRLPDGIEKKIAGICKRAYRVLRIQGYGRFDLRLTPENEVFILEANPNPILSKDEDFAQSAGKQGLAYKDLINNIMQLALRRVTVDQ